MVSTNGCTVNVKRILLTCNTKSKAGTDALISALEALEPVKKFRLLRLAKGASCVINISSTASVTPHVEVLVSTAEVTFVNKPIFPRRLNEIFQVHTHSSCSFRHNLPQPCLDEV
jgi:hypothetical protein